MKKNKKETTDLSLFKELIKALPQSSLYDLRNAITSEIRSKKYERGKFSPAYWQYSGLGDAQEKINALLDDDWSDLFDSEEYNSDEYYVYAHIDPMAEYISHIGHIFDREITVVKPIYIGMGTDDRWINFKRSNLHQEKLKMLLDSGFEKTDIAHKIATKLTKQQALELESKLILLWGCKASSSGEIRSYYGDYPCLFNNRYEPYPDSWGNMPCSHSIKVGA